MKWIPATEDNLQPGKYIRHFKGGVYLIIAVAIDTETLEDCIVYTSLKKGTIWVRTVAQSIEMVAGSYKSVCRFEVLEIN